MKENIPLPESPNLRESALEALREFKENGDEAKEAAIKNVRRWIEAEEGKRNLGEQGDLEAALAYAQLYEEAGLLDYALEAYEDALMVAQGEGNEERKNWIQERIAQLSNP